MFPSIGFAEFMVLAIVALIVVGPRELPLLMRRIGAFVKRARAMAAEFQRSFEEIGRETELEELRKEIDSLKRMNPMEDVRRELRETEQAARRAVGDDKA